MSEPAKRRTRGGGGAARRARRTAVKIETAKFIERQIPNYEMLDQAALEIIEHNAETVLEEIGVNFVDNPQALEIWRKAGATIDGERVKIPRGLARKLCASAPSKFTQHAQAMDAIFEVGPGGHFLGCEHTQNNFKDSFYTPLTPKPESFGLRLCGSYR